jgi:glyoxylase-like metal-dependent hydrolase (beta-lactamase superfamily II)
VSVPALPAGIHLLPIPTPFLVGRVNCYLLDGPPLTLVDTGPNSGKSLDELERALAGVGRRVEDLELIVLSHQHVDHTGLLEVLVRRSRAEVAGLSLLAGYLRDYPASAAADDAFAQAVMREHGVPGDTVTVLGAVSGAYRAFGSHGRIDRELGPGDVLQVGERRLEVLHRPGHSPTDTLFWAAEEGLALGGDHLLSRISSNPLIARPPELPADADPQRIRRPRALVTYLDSLRATRAMPLRLLLSGHGEPVHDHVALIDERMRMHQRRAEKILRLISSEPLSAYEIAVRMWGNVAVTQAYLTLSEVVGHLDLLLVDGRAEELAEGELRRFRALAQE